jgi:integrase
MGFTVDGRDDPGFRGRNGQRDGAFVDGLYGTGLRLQEWGSVLVAELPADDPHREFSTCRLAAATAKYGRGRRYWLPRRVLVEVLGYVEGERAHAVRRARQAGRYERLEGARVVTRVLGARRLRLRTIDDRPADVSLDALDPAARRRLLVETADGLEPAGLWLNEDGLPRDPHGWEHTFTTANERLARLGFDGFAGSPHMMRHSFALRWYSVGRLLYEARFAYLTEDETRDFREQFGNAWDLVQMMLGHADQRTTRETYLEPFRSLEMELLMLHAVEAAIPDLMARIFGDERRVLGDPLAGAR